MKGTEKTLGSILMFLVILAFLSTSFFIGSLTTTGTNFTQSGNVNVSLISGKPILGIDRPPACEFSGDWVDAIGDGLSCAVGLFKWVSSFFALDSPFLWLGLIFTILIIVLTFIMIRLIRGGG